MNRNKWIPVACAACAVLASNVMAQQPSDSRRLPANDMRAYDRGYADGYAAARAQVRNRVPRTAGRPSYGSEYTPFNPYAAQNRPHASMPPAMSAARDRTEIRGRYEEDEYTTYPANADYPARPGDYVAPRRRAYDPGDFRDEQGGIYGNRGVLMWTDRYDTGDYVNKYWNTHRDNVYYGQRVWNTNNGDQ